MANHVYANNMEVSCKAASGKSICAFPDVCFTPPQTPATPPGVPIPYPNTGMASDCTDGSRSVKISGQEVMLKNKSYFKRSTGDEAGAAPKKGVVTSKNMGKVYFKAWSMDVKVEGENVVRHLDITTHNHASEGPNSPPMAHVDAMAASAKDACSQEISEGKAACAGKTTEDCGEECAKKQKCLLVPKGQDKEICCKDQVKTPAGTVVEKTGHHLVEDHWVAGVKGFPMAQGSGGYNAAPTVCTNRFRSRDTSHRDLHDIQGAFEESYMPGGSRYDASKPNGGWNYAAGKEACLTAHATVFDDCGCTRKCMEAQLDAFYGSDGSRPLQEPSTQALGEDQRPDLLDKWGPVK